MEELSEAETQVYRSLKESGLYLKPSWIKQAIASQTSRNNMERVIFQLALYADLRSIGFGCLPNGIGSASEICKIEGRYVLQVEELVNISEPADSRREETKSRTLKLLLTDGLQTLVGLEVRGIKDLNVNSPAGIKVLCENFEMRRGIALFGPDNLKVVGGMVADLERSRLERIERLECAKKRRQLVPVMPPPAPEGEQSQQLPPSRPIQGADGGAMQDDFVAPRSASNSQAGEAPHRMAGHRGVSGAPVRLGAPHSAGSAEWPSRRHAPQVLEMPEGQAAAAVPGAMRSISRLMADPDPDVAMIDIDSDEQAPAAPCPHSAPSPQLPLLPPCSLGYLRQLLKEPPHSGGASASAGRRAWVQVAVMGIGRFECNPAAGGYSLRLVLVDGTARVIARAGDAVVERLMGIPSAEYAQCDKRLMKPQRARLSSLLSRLEGRFHLTPCSDPGGDGDGGEVPRLEVLEIDSGLCRNMARALAERVDRALAGMAR